MSNVRIHITTLLVELRECGATLSVAGDRLRICFAQPISELSVAQLRQHKADIIDRLAWVASQPDTFRNWLQHHCLFYAGPGVATPKAEMTEAYLVWAARNQQKPLSQGALEKRLCHLGCEEWFFQGQRWWNHVMVRWPASNYSQMEDGDGRE